MPLFHRSIYCKPLIRGAVFLWALASLGATASADITLNMRDADVRSVIDWMADVSGRHFIVDPSVQGQVTVLAKEPLSMNEAFEVFVRALELNGFSTNVKGNTVSIVPSARAADNHMAVLDSFAEHSDSEKAVHVFTTHSVNAATIVEQLQPLVGQHGTLAHFPSSNSVLIADRVDNIKRMRALIARLDQRGQVDVDVIPLRYLTAEAALASMQQLVSKEPAALQPALATDQRSNSLLVSGSSELRSRVRTLLKSLDTEISQSGQTEVVFINYLNASELVPVLESVVSDAKQNAPTAAHASIQVSESVNALVLTAPEPELKTMKEVIAEIDVPRRQVLLEAIIVEVNDDLVQDLGVQWNTAFNGEGGEAATEFGLQAPDSVLGRGFTLGYYRNGDLRALLNALSSTTAANLLSTPSIVAMDNEQAEILVGSNVPVISGQQTSSSSSTADPFTTLERHDIGVSLQITPQLNQQDSITLDILQKVENISTSNVAEDLIFDKRSIKTKVLVENDEVLVLGGLTRQDERQIVDKVPVLGYIPVLGRLFQRSTDETVRSNLMVFIHPRIIDKKAERVALSKQRYQAIRNQQLAAGQSSQAESPLLENIDKQE